ncbi:mRNA splicing protein [Sorochytrium milnesiophthora]
MTSLGFLPAPRNALPTTSTTNVRADRRTTAERDGEYGASDQQLVSKAAGPPPYGSRKGFLPSSPQDFGDGGAFPEIHIPQYPLDMGRDKTTARSNTVALQVDAEGNIKYDAIIRQGHGKDKIIHSQYKDLVPIDIANNQSEWARPSNDEAQETTDKTRLALEKIVSGKIKASKPKSLSVLDKKPDGPTFVKYTPGMQNGKEGKSRIIRMVEMPVDPMEPPKFGFKRLPGGPPSPPAPVMHSPPRKVTKEQQAEWNIPPCISNWKNAKGFTIPLDKRLAADGRGLQETHINDGFAKFSEALLIAERHAREEVRQRASMQQKLAQKEKLFKEDNLRQLAQRAREERAGIVPSGDAGGRREASSSPPHQRRGRSSSPDSGDDDRRGRHGDREEDDKAYKEREEIRRDKARQLQKEFRMSHMGQDAKVKHAKTMQERDISEKIALGVAQPTAGKDSMFDQRLFNQSEGLSSGFGNDDSYNLYDKPLFSGGSSGLSSIYRPKAAADDEMYGGDAAQAYNSIVNTDRFTAAPGRGFTGAEGEGQSRDGPVQFERESATSDPFGHQEFMKQAKKGRPAEGDDRDHGKRSRHD